MTKEKKSDDDDLGAVFGTEEEAAWKKIRDGAEQELLQNKRAIIIGKHIIKLAERMMQKEADT